jgi:hypothetical protein
MKLLTGRRVEQQAWSFAITFMVAPDMCYLWVLLQQINQGFDERTITHVINSAIHKHGSDLQGNVTNLFQLVYQRAT